MESPGDHRYHLSLEDVGEHPGLGHSGQPPSKISLGFATTVKGRRRQHCRGAILSLGLVGTAGDSSLAHARSALTADRSPAPEAASLLKPVWKCFFAW